MVEESKTTLQIDLMLVSLPEGDIAGSVDMMRELPAHSRGYYAFEDVLQKPGPDVLKATRKC